MEWYLLILGFIWLTVHWFTKKDMALIIANIMLVGAVIINHIDKLMVLK